jgi:hypothetical protein
MGNPVMLWSSYRGAFLNILIIYNAVTVYIDDLSIEREYISCEDLWWNHVQLNPLFRDDNFIVTLLDPTSHSPWPHSDDHGRNGVPTRFRNFSRMTLHFLLVSLNSIIANTFVTGFIAYIPALHCEMAAEPTGIITVLSALSKITIQLVEKLFEPSLSYPKQTFWHF